MKPMPSFLLFLLAAVPVLAADAPPDRMTRIENGLRPKVTIEGDTPWTLEERMRHFEVPAVSIAVIQDFKVVAYRVYGIAEEYGWAGYAPYPKLEVQQAALELYPGRYHFNAEQAFTIERREDRLFMQYAGGDAHELHNVGEARYVRREQPWPITFTVEGSVATFHFIQRDGSPQNHHRMADDEQTPREILIAEGYEKALPVYRELAEQSPDDPAISQRWLNRQGLGMADRALYEPAIGLLRIATELYPDSANTYDSVGYVYRQMGLHDSALHWYRKALEVDPEFPSAVEAVAELEAEREAGGGTCAAESTSAEQEEGR